MEDRLFTTQEVAREMSVSDAHVRRMIGQGKAHPLRQMGGTWFFSREEVERLRARPKPKGRPPKK